MNIPIKNRDIKSNNTDINMKRASPSLKKTKSVSPNDLIKEYPTVKVNTETAVSKAMDVNFFSIIRFILLSELKPIRLKTASTANENRKIFKLKVNKEVLP